MAGPIQWTDDVSVNAAPNPLCWTAPHVSSVSGALAGSRHSFVKPWPCAFSLSTHMRSPNPRPLPGHHNKADVSVDAVNTWFGRTNRANAAIPGMA
jgi:hypothetical protein